MYQELSKTDSPIPRSRDRCALNLAILIGAYMKCVCGLSFMKVDWLHNRKRGYCSIKCRKKEVMRKLKVRNENKTVQSGGA
jgi:hypothetical protein